MSDKKQQISKNVFLTGFTSFFTDISSEMIYPLLQSFVSVIMKAQAAFLGPVLGIIEGIAESTASLLKVFVGFYSDKIANRKNPAIAGYAASAFAKILYFIPFWFCVFLARLFDRIGKGIRTAPRDAIISESTPKDMQGKAFGIQRAMDFAGAFIGTIICYLIIKFVFPDFDEKSKVSPDVFYPIFIAAIIPAFIGVIFLFFIKEKKKDDREIIKREKPQPNLNIFKYDKNLKVFFLAQFLFTLGNSSNQFLLLRSTNLGFSLSTVILMYIFFNFTSSILSPRFGSLSDRIGRKKLLMSGYILYAIIYAAFGFLAKDTAFLLWIFWPIYGVYYAMTEGVEKAFVSDISPKDSKATALGFYNTIVGIGLLPASIIAGFLFAWIPSAPFIFGGIMSFTAVVIILFFVNDAKLLKGNP